MFVNCVLFARYKNWRCQNRWQRLHSPRDWHQNANTGSAAGIATVATAFAHTIGNELPLQDHLNHTGLGHSLFIFDDIAIELVEDYRIDFIIIATWIVTDKRPDARRRRAGFVVRIQYHAQNPPQTPTESRSTP